MQPGNAELKLVQEVDDAIITYGVPALGLVLIVIVPPITIIWAKSRLIAYASLSEGLAFLITYGFLSIIVQYFPQLLFSKSAALFGKVWEVPNGFKVQVRENELDVGYAYVKRENHADDLSLFNEKFLLFPVRHPRCLAIIIDSTDPNKGQEFFYNIDGLEKTDVTSMKQLILRAKTISQDSIRLNGWREQNGDQVPPPLKVEQTSAEHLCGNDNEDPPANQVSDLFGYIFGVAYAADHNPTPAPPRTHPPAPSPRPLTLENIRPRLQNDDAFVRTDARSDLARLGARAGPIVSQLLSSGNYRLELGGLAAIAEMPKEQRAGLPDEVKKQVQSHTNSSDPTIRATALRALSGF
jgi:hypothetical protein